MAVSETIAAEVAQLQATRPARAAGELPTAFELDRIRFVAEASVSPVSRLGSTIDDLVLLDVDGAPTRLYAALGDDRAVVVFYRGEWCPYCSIALRHYERELVPALDARGVRLLAISPQLPDGSLKTKEKLELSFTVLSDPGNRLARQLGIVITPSSASLERQRSRGLDLAERNADGTPELPMPTTLIVDADHTVRWIDVHPDYVTRTETSEIISALEVR